MEINRFKMSAIAQLAQDAGPQALKGLNDLERKVLKAMMKALQKGHDPVSVKDLDEHQFKELKEYLKKAAAEKKSGHIFEIPSERKRDKEKLKGFKNIFRTRIGTSTLEKEIDKAVQSTKPVGKGSDIERKASEYTRKIKDARMRIETIKTEARVQERERILGFLKPLERRLREPRRDFDVVLEERAALFGRMRKLAEEAIPHMPDESLQVALEHALALAYDHSIFEAKLTNIASFLKHSPGHAKELEVLQGHAEVLSKLLASGAEKRDLILQEAIAEHEEFLEGTHAEVQELEATIAKNLAALEEPLKAKVKTRGAATTAKQRKLEQLEKEIDLLQRHVQFLAENGKEYRENLNEGFRQEWIEIRKNSKEELKSKNLTVRMRRTLKEIRALDKIKDDPASAIRRKELVKHLRHFVSLRRAKSDEAKLSMIKTWLESPIRKSKLKQDATEDKLMKQYLKITDTLQRRKAKLETR
ncbi:MAG: hypothetical protein LLG04_07760 [Parachlamydia sp.]|nr:hypothetical protein [Parachlamydia sp.]